MMKKTNAKRILAAALAGMMALSLSACGEQGGGAPTEGATTESASTAAVAAETKAEAGSAAEPQDSGKTGEEATGGTARPEAVSQEDWEAMQKEPAFGTTLNYLFNGGACVSAVYLAEALGYYEDYGINAEYIEGESVVITVGTGKCLWGTDHIATMLVPVTNGVDMTFVAGAHMGCKSIYVFNDSEIKTAEDLKGKTIAIHDGIGNSDQNIIYRMLDGEGIDPTSEVEYLDIADSAASVAAMESGEIDASIFSDYFVIANYRDKMRKVCSITPGDEFEGEVCCATAMNNDFLAKNPVHAKYIVMAIKRAGQYARLHSEDAVQLMFDTNKMTGEFENQLEFWDSLDFGLSDAITEEALGNIAADYIRLGVIQKKELTADDVMKLAWTNACPDEEVPGLTVGDPKDVEGRTVEVQQKGE